MRSDLETQTPKTPVLRKITAGLILVAVAALAIHLIIGFFVAIFWIAIVAAAVVAVLWALKTLVW